VSRWLRLFLFIDPKQLTGTPVERCRPGEAPNDDFCNNAYPNPGDARDNQPFDGYPRLKPFDARARGIERPPADD
jgi:hypothetical protein